MTGRWLEDYVVGTVQEFGPVLVEEDDVIAFAQRFDAQPFHLDREAAAAGPAGGLIASGWHTVALMISLFATEYLSPVSSLPSPGADELRWFRPVRPGQSLVLRTTVAEARPSRSKPDRGMVRTRLEGLVSGEVVCSLVLTNLIRTRPRS